MKLARLLGQVRFFGAGVVDQMLISGANFLAGFLMIRYTTDLDYGHFVLAQSAILLIVSAQGAWLSGPLATVLPTKSDEHKRRMVGALQASQTRVLRWAALSLLIADAIGWALHVYGAVPAIVGATTILAGWAALQREFLRSVMLATSRPNAVLQADGVYVGCLLAGIGLAVAYLHPPGIVAIGALIVAAWAGMLVSYRIYAASPGWTVSDAGPHWAELRPLGIWATVGAVIYWLFAQSYNYVLAVRLDLTAVTSVNAARLLIMPVFVFMIGLNNLLMPMAANWLAKFGLRRMLRGLALMGVVITGIDLCYIAVVWLFRGWLIGDLLHKSIPDRDRLLLLWACMALVFLPREILQSGLYALRQIRLMAWMVALSAAVSLAIMWLGSDRWGAAIVLIGQLSGECVNIAGLSVLLWLHVRRHGEHPVQPAAP